MKAALQFPQQSTRPHHRAGRGARAADEIAEAREAERRTLARDLHDGLGQSLVVLQMNLRAALAELAPDSSAARLLDSSVNLLNGLHRDIRGRALTLHSSLLDDLGLVPALRSHVAEVSRATQVRVGFDFGGQSSLGRWPATVETCAFRIAQEALTNALRHSQAARIDVAVADNVDGLVLRVEDNGVGFDATAERRAVERRSLGLVSMAERARLAGGLLAITSSHRRGTSVSLRFDRRRLRAGPVTA